MKIGKTAGKLLFVGAVALSLTACQREPAYADRVCSDATGHRVADWNCNGGGQGAGYPGNHAASNPFLWYYLGTLNGRSYAPIAYGQPLYGGGYRPVAGVSYGASGFAAARASAASSGIARGGFGAAAHASGGAGE